MTSVGFYQKLAGHKRITTRDAAQLTGMSIPAASMALRRLAAGGLSMPLKKGSWLLGAPSSKPGVTPALFGGYDFDSRVDGFVASPEKAVFDLAYLAAMNRSRVTGSLPETDLSRLQWRKMRDWVRRIKTSRVRDAVEKNLERMRKQHAESRD